MKHTMILLMTSRSILKATISLLFPTTVKSKYFHHNLDMGLKKRLSCLHYIRPQWRSVYLPIFPERGLLCFRWCWLQRLGERVWIWEKERRKHRKFGNLLIRPQSRQENRCWNPRVHEKNNKSHRNPFLINLIIFLKNE